MKNDLIIPVDDAIVDFKNHLLSHPRTILSARFGDGKSFFLEKFIKSPKVSRKFLCLRVFPVNYQVLDNKDIFELVKRDILLQLIYNNMIPEDYEISEEVAFAFYIRNKGVGLTEDLLTYAAMFTPDNPQWSSACAITAGSVKLLEKLSEKFKKFKEENCYVDIIEKYLKDSNKHFLLEEDIITVIIRDCIERYRKDHRGRRVALFFEDMDRIDPAHLFRIMNVLSAQMDYNYKYGIRPSTKARRVNKFGVDNIVLVLDYKNLQSIFAHFYGEGVNFKGYIHKFTSSTIFTYSLKEQKYHYMLKQIAADTRFRDVFLQEILPIDMFDNYSMRDLAQALIDTESQIKEKVVWKTINQTVALSTGPLRLFVILRRLGKTDEQLKQVYTKAIREQSLDFIVWVGGYFLKMHNSFGLQRFSFDDGEDTEKRLKIEGMRDDGRAIVKDDGRFGSRGGLDAEDLLWEYLIGLIAK